MPRLTGLSDRDAGLGTKIAYFFTKRRFKQMTGGGNRDDARAAADVCVYPQAAQRISAAWSWRSRRWTSSAPAIARSPN